MHRNPAVVLGCADCHGGNPLIAKPAGSAYQGSGAPAYRAALDRAHVQPRFPQEWKYPSSATPPADLHAAQSREPGVRALHQSRRLPRRARSVRRVPSADHSGGRAQPDGHQRDVLGRRRVQQRHSAVQELRSWAKRTRATAAGAMIEDPVDARCTQARARHFARAVSRCRRGKPCRRLTSSACSSAAAAIIGSQFPEIGLPNVSGACRRWTNRAVRIFISPIAAPGTGARDRGTGAQHREDAPERSAHVVPGHQRSAGRLSLLRLLGLPRRVRQ